MHLNKTDTKYQTTSMFFLFLHSREDTLWERLIIQLHFPLMLLWRITLRMSCAHISRHTAGLKLRFELSLWLMNPERQITPRSDPLIQKVQNVSFVWYQRCDEFWTKGWSICMDLVHNNISIVSHVPPDALRHKGAGASTTGSSGEASSLVPRQTCASARNTTASVKPHIFYRRDEAPSGGNQLDFSVRCSLSSWCHRRHS